MSTQVTPAQRISDFQQLVNEHEADIRRHGNAAWNEISKGSEVQRVHEFLSSPTAGNSLLNRELAPLFTNSGWVVKFAGIFLHQKPYVKGFLPDDTNLLPQRCELGDLQTLFVYVRRDKTPQKTRSVIFQAKLKPAAGNYDVSHPMQRQLYDDSPRFRYETVLQGQIRQLPSGEDRKRAVQYLFVNESPVTVKTLPSMKRHGAFEDYGEHLLRFLNDSTGLDVNTNNSADGWSQIVNDMIAEFNKEVYKGASAGKFIRQQGLEGILNPFNSFESHDVVFLDAKHPKKPEKPGDGEPGFGLQLIIVWDGELGDDASMQMIAPEDQLRRLADYYDTSHYEDYALRIQRKNELVEEMSQLIRSKEIKPEMVLHEAVESVSQGLAAALGQVLCEAPRKGWGLLLEKLIPSIKWLHTIKLVLSAILACEPSGVPIEAAKRIREIVQDRLKEDTRVQHLLKQIESVARR